ncbi:MAG TPA: hypothetical protein VFT29_18380 [Gemmatimonadaceae bacterium]|nr:hypothetical protein [Gemmatimonadaceae bacterium]
MSTLACLVLAVVVPLRIAAQQTDSTWRDHDRAAREARLRGDWAQALAHTRRVDSLISGHPRVAFAIARAQVHLGDTAAAVASLQRVADMGLTDLLADSEFTTIRTTNPQLTLRLRDNAKASGSMSIAAVLPADDFIAEGITYDAKRRRLLVTSIRRGVVVQVDEHGRVSDFVDLVRNGGWTAFGLAVDEVRGRLWVATSWQPHNGRLARGDSGRTGVMLYDLERGRFVRRYDLPGLGREPGDLCVGANGDLFVSDGRQGEIFVLPDGADSLRVLVSRGPLVSPQGCAVDGAGRLLVADYVLGPVAVETRTGGVTLISHSSTDALNGIDGMILRGDWLVGVQNGVNPNRVIAMRLDAGHHRVTSARVLAQDTVAIREPTHLTTIGTDVLFIANGGFGMFDEKGNVRAGAVLVAPRIGRVRLP